VVASPQEEEAFGTIRRKWEQYSVSNDLIVFRLIFIYLLGIAGAIGLVLLFIAVTTALRKRRARKFDRDVTEAAAAAAASSANPFFEDEDDRGNAGANWDPRRGSAYNAGYGKVRSG
jgi:hypothetical protein